MELQSAQQLDRDDFCTPLPYRPAGAQETDHRIPCGGLSVKYGSDDDMSTGGMSMRSPDPRSSCPCVSIDIPDSNDPLDEFLTKPLPLEHGKLRCVVRQKGPTEVHMLLEKGNVFLMSARRIGREWVITAHANPDSREKALAYLRYDKKERAFTCFRRDALKATRVVRPKPQEYLYLQQSTLELNEDLPELNTMRVAFLPSETDMLLGSSAGELAALLRDPDLAQIANTSSGPAVLFTKIPKWNARSYAFELPFHGRAACASERNLQLVCQNYDHSERVVFLHGKLDEETFSLDFRYPLSPMHAFVISMSTWDW